MRTIGKAIGVCDTCPVRTDCVWDEATAVLGPDRERGQPVAVIGVRGGLTAMTRLRWHRALEAGAEHQVPPVGTTASEVEPVAA